jgi:co-chaperonin GroES (HSP10)
VTPQEAQINAEASGLVPLGHAVLCLAYEPEFARSVIIIPPTVAERSIMVETRVTVLAVGPKAWDSEGQPRAAPGDKVFISQLCGAILHGADGRKYRMVNDADIYCRIDREPTQADIERANPADRVVSKSDLKQMAEKAQQQGRIAV